MSTTQKRQAIISGVESSIIENVRKNEFLEKKYDYVLFTGREMQIILFEMEKRHKRSVKQYKKDVGLKNGFRVESQRRTIEIATIVNKINEAEIKRGAGYNL